MIVLVKRKHFMLDYKRINTHFKIFIFQQFETVMSDKFRHS